MAAKKSKNPDKYTHGPTKKGARKAKRAAKKGARKTKRVLRKARKGKI